MIGAWDMARFYDSGDRNFLFDWQGTANHDKIIKSLKYGLNRAQLQHAEAAPGWGFSLHAYETIEWNLWVIIEMGWLSWLLRKDNRKSDCLELFNLLKKKLIESGNVELM